jgi:nitrogenase molybdenum-cofactor synthesis protein NifE
MNNAISYTVKELWERGKNDIPREMISNTHLIYSSPATLSFNSPGAEGFGVKRAGLSVPGSVMLIVSPGCCGRNTSSISTMKGYENRFFYLTMDETDLITGRHLKRIPEAVRQLVGGLTKKPSVVMICITCVDALLGTDMERVCRKAEALIDTEHTGIRVRPCYMYALTREGRKPPMVHVRQSIYSLLAPMKKKPSSVNLMGYFAPVSEESELRGLLRQIGVRTIREVSACQDYDDFLSMAEANFNLVLNPEARPAAQDLEEKLGIASIELTRLYQVDRIAAQYNALGAALGVTFDYEADRDRAKSSMKRFREAFPGAVFSVGEAINADPFELSLALVRYGFQVKEIFGTLSTDSYRYLRHLAVLSPETRVYSNLHPSMLLYEDPERQGPNTDQAEGPHIALGRDAGWYHSDLPCLAWGQDLQPFGFAAVRGFFDALYETAMHGARGLYGSTVQLGEHTDAVRQVLAMTKKTAQTEQTDRQDGKTDAAITSIPPKGFRSVLTPFAPDQSGAVSVLYELGGITVICDAGGCTGNICGFDEPRWFQTSGAVFSAGLRDMDAILGRDDRLIQKLADTASFLREKEGAEAPAFTAIVGTPVPAVIGTDFKALQRMAVKTTGLPCIGVACDGMEYYDKGAEKTYLSLLKTFSPGSTEDLPAWTGDCIGVLGAQSMDLHGIAAPGALRALIEEETKHHVVLYGSREDGIDAFRRAGSVRRNLVVTVAGYEAARWLEETHGTPFTCHNPAVASQIRDLSGRIDLHGCKVLVLHEQITANSCREELLRLGADRVDVASWFMMKEALMQDGDFRLHEEQDLVKAMEKGRYDCILTDAAVRPLIEWHFAGVFAELPHFAVSGRL